MFYPEYKMVRIVRNRDLFAVLKLITYWNSIRYCEISFWLFL